MIDLASGDYRIALEPERGGSVARFDWAGHALLRPTCGPSILDTACFPLVPFSNRIAHGRFSAAEQDVTLRPNFPGSDHPHPLHGFGWLSPWRVEDASAHAALLSQIHRAGEWPWTYEARQAFQLSGSGLVATLSLRNLDDTAMPAGLGFHPYFPRDAGTRYIGLHRTEWTNSEDCLPLSADTRPEPIDWWAGDPVGTRAVDTVYSARSGQLTILWLERGIALSIEPSEALSHTVVYTPTDADFFCVEPVSHRTDAFNGGEHHLLQPGEELSVSMRLSASHLDS